MKLETLIIEDGNHPGYLVRGTRVHMLVLELEGRAPHVVHKSRIHEDGNVQVYYFDEQGFRQSIQVWPCDPDAQVGKDIHIDWAKLREKVLAARTELYAEILKRKPYQRKHMWKLLNLYSAVLDDTVTDAQLKEYLGR